ncbi:MAG: hypothetical protein LC800_20815, partial [Acidobacteria bacterium]|nr:hypothetical protein [Acidobacteriota bacterium]
MNQSLPRRCLGALCAAALLSQQFVLVAQPPPQPAKKFELTVDSIMRGPALVGYQPESVRWSRDSRRVYFRWKQPAEPRLKEMDLYVVGRDGSDLRKLSEDEAREAPPASGDLSKDKTMTVYAEEGDVFIYEHARGARRQVTRTTEAELNPRFTADGKRVYFTRGGNLYALSLDGGSLEQLTDIRTGGGGAGGPQAAGGGRGSGAGSEVGTESQEYLKKEERRLLEA